MKLMKKVASKRNSQKHINSDGYIKIMVQFCLQLPYQGTETILLIIFGCGWLTSE